MLIELTLSQTKMPLYLRAVDVIVVERNTNNPLETAVITGIMTNKGPMIYPVLESPKEVAEKVNHALLGREEVERRLRSLESALEVYRFSDQQPSPKQ